LCTITSTHLYGSADGHLFYSVSDEFECDTGPLDGRSMHCIGLTVPDYVNSPNPDEKRQVDQDEERDFPETRTRTNLRG
jgi:hypothetical protein